jgi:hypothetical protein
MEENGSTSHCSRVSCMLSYLVWFQWIGRLIFGWSSTMLLLQIPKNRQPIELNGAVNVICSTLKCVAASAAKAKLGPLFHNAKEAKALQITLEELGHIQPHTPIHIDNSTTVGILNNTMKRHKSRSMEMHYFWLLDSGVQKLFDFLYHPGIKNLAYYPSKHHTGAHHIWVCLY